MSKLDFGDYCNIEQKRYGVEDEMFMYKVIGTGKANYYRSVPADANNSENQHGPIVDIVKVIMCGVSEDRVETFRLKDVEPVKFSRAKESNKLLMMFVRDGYANASGKPRKKTALALMKFVSQDKKLEQLISNSDWAKVESYE